MRIITALLMSFLFYLFMRVWSSMVRVLSIQKKQRSSRTVNESKQKCLFDSGMDR